MSFKEITDFQNLMDAYEKSAKCKRERPYVLQFSQDLYGNLLRIKDELEGGTYKLGEYKVFTIREPKTRKIYALPFRDRIVQHAINTVIEPAIDRTFIYDTYACRKNKGVLQAAKRARYFMQSSKAAWYVKCDVEHFFPSVDKEILRRLYMRFGFDEGTQDLLEKTVLLGGRGLPIGNLLSQLSANLYLSELDRFCKHTLKIRRYIRYMDDIVCFCETADDCKRVAASIDDFLREKLNLHLNERTVISRCEDGLDFVGYRIFKGKRLLRKKTMLKSLRRMRKTKNADLKARRIASLYGYAKNTAGEAYILRVLMREVFPLMAVAATKGERLAFKDGLKDFGGVGSFGGGHETKPAARSSDNGVEVVPLDAD